MYGSVIPRACFIVLTPALPPWTFPTMSPGHDLGNWIEYIAFLTLCVFNWNEFPYLFLRKTDILCSFGHSSGVKGFPKSGNFCVLASSVSLPLYNKWSGNRQRPPGFSLISTVLSHGFSVHSGFVHCWIIRRRQSARITAVAMRWFPSILDLDIWFAFLCCCNCYCCFHILFICCYIWKKVSSSVCWSLPKCRWLPD